MADSNNGKGLSTGMVVAISLGTLALGAIGTAAVYEMYVVPNAIEEARGGSSAQKVASNATAGK